MRRLRNFSERPDRQCVIPIVMGAVTLVTKCTAA